MRLTDGRVIEAITRATADGGWVSSHEDVTERLRYEKVLRQQNVLFDAALENMAHGLCVFDKDWRVVVRNRRYLELYGLGPDDALPGTPLVELMRQSIDRGMHTTKVSAEKFFADFVKRVEVDREPVVFRRLTSGKLLAVRHSQWKTAAGSAPSRISRSASSPRTRSRSSTAASTSRSTTWRMGCACSTRKCG